MTTPASPVSLGSINMEADDPHALASFWAEITDGTLEAAGDRVYLPPAGPGGFAMYFQPLTGPRPARNIVHLDRTVPWGNRVATVDRLLARGATHLWDVLEEHEHVQWTTLADPRATPFASPSTRPPATGS